MTEEILNKLKYLLAPVSRCGGPAAATAAVSTGLTLWDRGGMPTVGIRPPPEPLGNLDPCNP